MRVIVGISGASGIELAERFLQRLPNDIERFTILSENAQTVIQMEQKDHLGEVFQNSEIGAKTASGSFGCDAMIIVPCSMNSLAKIACGIADNLITRTASVMIKEQKKLILAPRELPLSAIALENMLKLARLNVLIAPPIAGYYTQPDSIAQMEDFLVGKWFDLLGIEHNLYRRWGE